MLTYKGFGLGFQINGRFGGVVTSSTEALLDRYGVSKRSAEAREALSLIHIFSGCSFSVKINVGTLPSNICKSLGRDSVRSNTCLLYTSVTVDPDCIVVTSGSSPSILLALMLLCNPDSEVILSNPGYACYRCV